VLASVGEEHAKHFTFIEGDIADMQTCQKACEGVDIVLHQAALGSVPRSIDDPVISNRSNVTGFLNMITAAKDAGIKRFVYASSSSVYGDSEELPKVEERTGNVLSPYAAMKATNELYGSVFHKVYGMETLGLRYFNVFGLVDKSTYWGFPLDNNVIILVFLFLFDGLLSPAIFGLILYALLMTLAALNVAPIKTPKFTGRWYYFITGYALLFTIIYGCKML